MHNIFFSAYNPKPRYNLEKEKRKIVNLRINQNLSVEKDLKLNFKINQNLLEEYSSKVEAILKGGEKEIYVGDNLFTLFLGENDKLLLKNIYVKEVLTEVAKKLEILSYEEQENKELPEIIFLTTRILPYITTDSLILELDEIVDIIQEYNTCNRDEFLEFKSTPLIVKYNPYTYSEEPVVTIMKNSNVMMLEIKCKSFDEDFLPSNEYLYLRPDDFIKMMALVNKEGPLRLLKNLDSSNSNKLHLMSKEESEFIKEYLKKGEIYE